MREERGPSEQRLVKIFCIGAVWNVVDYVSLGGYPGVRDMLDTFGDFCSRSVSFHGSLLDRAGGVSSVSGFGGERTTALVLTSVSSRRNLSIRLLTGREYGVSTDDLLHLRFRSLVETR